MKKNKRALIMMTLILPMSWNLETLVKENGPTSLKGKLIDKLVLGVVRIVKHVCLEAWLQKSCNVAEF